MADPITYLIGLIPLTGWGAYSFTRWLTEKMKIRKGCFKVIFRMGNHRIKTAFLKPEKDNLQFDGRTYPISYDVGYIYYAGATPQIEFDEHGNQINFSDKDKTPGFDPGALNTLAKRTYNLGKKHASKNERLLLMGVIVAAGCSAMGLLMMFSLLQGMPVG